MATRRFLYRKPPSRPLSKAMVRLCLLLGAVAVILPLSSSLIHSARIKARNLAFTSGFIDLNSCVVTSDHKIICTSDAVGTPVPVALRQMEDAESQAAAERKQRLDAEGTVRSLALEVARLTTQVAERQQAEGANASLPVGDVTATARTGTGASVETGDGSVMTSGTGQQSRRLDNAAAATAGDTAIPFSFTPPDTDAP